MKQRLNSQNGKVKALAPLLLIIILAVLLRVAVAFYLGNSIEEVRGGTFDQISYDALALRVMDGHGFSFATDSWPYAKANQPTAFWSYLFTLFLAGIYSLAGHEPLVARIIQAILVGIVMPWLVYRIGARVFDRRVGLIAALIAAIYFYFINYAASLMTESLYIVGILWTIDVAMRLAIQAEGCSAGELTCSQRHMLRLGLELGLAMAFTLLMRQVIVIFLPVLGLWLLWIAWRRNQLKGTILALAVAAFVTALALLPFVIRNYRAFGQVSMPNTNVGFNFFWSNHPIYGTTFVPVIYESSGITYPELIPPELRHLNEAELDRALLARGIQIVLEDPTRYLQLSLSRFPVYFLFWPTGTSSTLSNAARVLSFGIFLPFMIYGLITAFLRAKIGKSEQVADTQDPVSMACAHLHCEFLALLGAYMIVYTAIHIASWANVRYRLPVDVFLIIFAAYAIDDLLWRVLKIGSGKQKRQNPDLVFPMEGS
ncbi:MAG: glycosyltransferase family 39 protein [Chloroflexota bacterium]|nr:glycosyltransferase family 39 protein [Chloroflexota bacterium]